MFKYVAKEEVARYKAYCQSVLGKLIKRLEKECAVSAHITLVGSGAEDMVTRNGKGPFDLDYNLILTSVPQKYEDSPRLLRSHVKEILDSLVDGRFSHGKGKETISWFMKREMMYSSGTQCHTVVLQIKRDNSMSR